MFIYAVPNVVVQYIQKKQIADEKQCKIQQRKTKENNCGITKYTDRTT